MADWLTDPLPVLLKTAASSVGIMLITLLVIRIHGLRSLAKMSSAGFASTIAIGSILAAVAMNTDQSLAKGAVAIFSVLTFQQVMSFGKRKSPVLENVMENNPIFLMIGPDIIEENLASSGVSRADLMAKLREANVLRLADVKAVVFETTGDVSVLHGEGNIQVDELILGDVKR